ARCCALALTDEGADGRTLNVGTGVPMSIAAVAETIGRGLGKEIEPELVGKYRAGDIRHCYADTSLAQQLLGFRARVSLADGMQDLIRWLQDQEAADRVEAAADELATRGLAR